ncbi:hypothetical protein MVUOKPPV_CDS0055 [Klebsiella phage phi1_175008]|uniref:Uncharacterized protein n=1 Tax=Klebsiella phage phi1_175008 TaxID=3127744 RepID=A0ACD5FR29_9CAUD
MEAIVALLELLSKFTSDPTIFKYRWIKYTIWLLVSLLCLAGILSLYY